MRGETVDGYQVRLFANIESPREIEYAVRHGAAGVGLVRTEYLLFSRRRFPTEDEQVVVYRKMAARIGNRPLIIRIFDIGGDKKAPY